MSRKFLLPNLLLLLRRSTSTSPPRFCSLSGKQDRLFHDSVEDLNLGGAPQCPGTPSWFDDGSDASGDERIVSRSWDEGRSGGRKRGEEMEIAKLFLPAEIVSRLAGRGITKLFPIQRAVLEPAMQGRDMICRATTGTGKTLAYGIPIMDKIIRFKATPQAKRRRGRNPLALIMTPTRELAQQVEKEFRDSSPLRTVSVCGGEPFARQLNELNYGVEVLIGTPGRVNDLLCKNVLNLSNVQFVVLDESDEMLAVSFAETVEKILGRLPRRRQNIMFSSTMPSWMSEFQDIYLNNPLIIDLVGDSTQKLPDGLVLYSIASNKYQKHLIIGPLTTEHAEGGKCIVFTRSKRDVGQLSKFLGRNFKCEALHADMHQSHREKTLAGFREGNFNILVATDVAARGLHIPDVNLVIHYEVPSISENFLHRSGRTGRAGRKGKVILIHTEEQTDDVRIIEQDIGCKFIELPRMTIEDGDQLMLAGSDRFDGIRNSKFRHSGGNYQGMRQHNSSLKTSSKIPSGFDIPTSGIPGNDLGGYANDLFSKLAAMQSVNSGDYEGSTSEGLSCDGPQECASEWSGYTDQDMGHHSDDEGCGLGCATGFHHSSTKLTGCFSKPIASFGSFGLANGLGDDVATSISEEPSG